MDTFDTITAPLLIPVGSMAGLTLQAGAGLRDCVLAGAVGSRGACTVEPEGKCSV